MSELPVLSACAMLSSGAERPPLLHRCSCAACMRAFAQRSKARSMTACDRHAHSSIQRPGNRTGGAHTHPHACMAVQVLLYSKLAKSYFVFLEALCHNHHAFLVRQPHDTFARIMRCLELGVKSLDVTTSSQCAMAIDNLATWVHQNLIKVDELHQVHPAAQVLPLLLPSGLCVHLQTSTRQHTGAMCCNRCVHVGFRR